MDASTKALQNRRLKSTVFESLTTLSHHTGVTLNLRDNEPVKVIQRCMLVLETDVYRVARQLTGTCLALHTLEEYGTVRSIKMQQQLLTGQMDNIVECMLDF